MFQMNHTNSSKEWEGWCQEIGDTLFTGTREDKVRNRLYHPVLLKKTKKIIFFHKTSLKLCTNTALVNSVFWLNKVLIFFLLCITSSVKFFEHSGVWPTGIKLSSRVRQGWS